MTTPAPQLPTAAPASPDSIEATGVSFAFLQELGLKCIYQLGEVSGQQVADYLRLPFFNIVEKVLKSYVDDKYCEVLQGTSYVSSTWKYVLTVDGRRKALEVIARCAYTGPCPVSLAYYASLAKHQSPNLKDIHRPEVAEALSDLVTDPGLCEKLGPAVNSCRSIFLYGPPGNGKTSVGERIRRMFTGSIWVPYALEADNEVIRVFDPSIHTKVALSEAQAAQLGAPDRRWELVERPLVIVGGELTLAGLELSYDANSKCYTAPFQVKANGGILLIDDFGRQRMEPRELLNRWIVPLEKREDYLSLRTGKQLVIPFELLVVFATNIEPKDLVDEAFLRRIRYKIKLSDPSADEFREVFKRCCAANRVAYDDDAVTHLIQKHYVEAKRLMRSCHPRDLVDQITDRAKFLGAPPALTQESVDGACETYFVEF
ncbi:MAG TPA: AAA family ATPase [Elusimicrobia bacterium]|nr:AAA family ATPase [Elusimicrobiota bacterium]